MARIPEAEIERLKNEVSVERLVEASGIELKKAGKDWLGRCPFHEDDTASLVVTPDKNLWHCFGCGVGGGPIDWVIKKNGVSFRHAVELLRADPSLAACSDGAPGAVKRSRVARLPPPVALDAGEQELLNQVIDFYHQTLLASPEALAYLDRRDIGNRELIERFKLGFANRTLGLRLPVTQVKAGAEIRGRLQKLGILRESGHEHFNGCLVVPVFEDGPGQAGNVGEVYGRKITDGVNPPLHLYLPGPHRGVWNAPALAGAEEVILCEALIDAMSFWCAGHRNVTAAYGVEGFTDDHLAVFRQHGIRRVLIAFDRDEAGERGATKVAERLMAAGIDCYRIQFPKGMDANAYAQKVTPPEKSLGLAIRKAVWLGKGTAPEAPPGQRVEDVATDAERAGARAVDAQIDEVNTAEGSTAAPSMMTDEAVPALAAAPAAVPPAPTLDAPAQVSDDEVVMQFGDRRYRIRGLAKNLGYETLKVNVLVSRGDAYHVDTFDLYAARVRGQYLLHAAREIAVKEDIIKLDLGRVLLKCEAVQDARIKQALKVEPAVPTLSAAEQAEALALLQSPELIPRLLADFETCGLIGEETNKLIGYLAAVSRLLDRPLGVVIQSSSAAGKSSLMDAVLAFVPEEEKVKYSAMTGQSLFYMGETNLKHKALAIVEEEGASRASYALKLLQSEGELTIASTGKDPNTGNLITQQYRVEGPVALLLTTTARDLDEELMNRCLVLAVDEGREQTRAIHQLQRDRRTLAGLVARRDKESLIRLHQNAQRLLRPLDVLNPYAQFLTFPDQTTRLRRDHEKYLTLIDAIAFLHQHQRPVKTARHPGNAGQVIEYVEVTLADIALANRIAHDVLGRSLDELPPQTRRLLKLIDAHVRAEGERLGVRRGDFRFSRRALREAIAWGDTQLKLHLARLAELEYLIAHRTRTGGFDYELVYEVGDADGALRFPGLADIEALTCAYDAARSGDGAVRSAPGRGVDGGRPGAGRIAESTADAAPVRLADESPIAPRKTHVDKGNGASRSYARPVLAAAGVDA
ncbi:MAG: toprim domain-containing protein [Sulfuritalea sp.]|nr:toprim domain-containing protein [Sulfuritalea sp.]